MSRSITLLSRQCRFQNCTVVELLPDKLRSRLVDRVGTCFRQRDSSSIVASDPKVHLEYRSSSAVSSTPVYHVTRTSTWLISTTLLLLRLINIDVALLLAAFDQKNEGRTCCQTGHRASLRLPSVSRQPSHRLFIHLAPRHNRPVQAIHQKVFRGTALTLYSTQDPAARTKHLPVSRRKGLTRSSSRRGLYLRMDRQAHRAPVTPSLETQNHITALVSSPPRLEWILQRKTA